MIFRQNYSRKATKAALREHPRGIKWLVEDPCRAEPARTTQSSGGGFIYHTSSSASVCGVIYASHSRKSPQCNLQGLDCTGRCIDQHAELLHFSPTGASAANYEAPGLDTLF